jgi:cell division septation protein DedD
VSAVETPSPPTTVERRCPQCGAQLSADQEWCLDCGAAASTRIAAPRGWKVPLAVVGVLLALALIGIVLALVELAGDPEQVTEAPATPTPAPTAAAAPAVPPPASPTPGAETTPAPQQGGAQPSPGVDTWPKGETAWTVILNSSGTREDAERIAGELAAKGIPDVGVLDSDDFTSLGPDSFVVFSGQYEDRTQAEGALAAVRDRAGGGSTRRVVPKKG